ncbi:AraC family transcriptional regulator [Spirosoma foliorum]|uniref:Helix-turn-helix transcriptional regulator n=1 Tax=Spirosoma foliorum TaxID=2710596 RepID=A0A7G5GP05_9BACT|nr:helix-turn-helix transcriptional regulator [Spirosoma foliorum]QMW00597.1 helix-turn-helix transcriptional regulator [Spirosoma foliorum]
MFEKDNDLFASATARKPVSCASVAAEKPTFVYHQELGRFYTDWHQHPWGEFVYAENGFVHLHVAGKKVLLPSWYGAWIPPNTLHEIWSDSPSLHMRAICFPADSSTNGLKSELTVFPVSPLLKEMVRYTERWNEVEPADFREVTFLQAIQDLLPEEMTKSIHVCLPSTSHEKLAQLLDYLKNHLAEKISIETLAHQFGFSVRTLSRLCRQQLGVSFSSYCKLARMMKALELMEQGNDNVSEIASLVGYESLATFSNNFLDICGNRPLYFINKKRVQR